MTARKGGARQLLGVPIDGRSRSRHVSACTRSLQLLFGAAGFGYRALSQSGAANDSNRCFAAGWHAHPNYRNRRRIQPVDATH